MTRINWDAVGSRLFQTGIDRGVLYPPATPGIPWNGLTGVTVDRSGANLNSYYLDGVKYLDTIIPDDFSATLTAITYPDAFEPFDGVAAQGYGLFYDNQTPTTFAMSYRTKVGNDLAGPDFAYLVHILYNLTAQPTNKAYQTVDDTPAPSSFSWTVTGTPVSAPGVRPTSHVWLDSRLTSPGTLAFVEDILYGNANQDPRGLPLSELLTYLH